MGLGRRRIKLMGSALFCSEAPAAIGTKLCQQLLLPGDTEQHGGANTDRRKVFKLNCKLLGWTWFPTNKANFIMWGLLQRNVFLVSAL